MFNPENLTPSADEKGEIISCKDPRVGKTYKEIAETFEMATEGDLELLLVNNFEKE